MNRFWSKVEKSSGCWNWTAYRNPGGYGTIHIGGSAILAHRASWVMAKGEIPRGMCVLHRCDNRACVRPSHLFLGTLQDNNADMRGKGRMAKGNDYPQAKLTPEIVQKILADARTHREIAKDYRVDASLISVIKGRKIWRHVHA